MIGSRIALVFALSTTSFALIAQDPPKPTPAQEVKPSEAKPNEAKPSEAKPADAKAAEGKPADAKLAPKPIALGDVLPTTFQLKDLDGTVRSAADCKGKVTLINFYSIQCPVQAAWDDRLVALQKEFADKGVVFWHIDSNVTEIGKDAPADPKADKSYAAIRAHLSEQKLPFTVLADHGNAIADMLDARTTPHVYVFAADGKLVYRGLVDDDQRGDKTERKSYARDVLQKLLAGEPVAPSATKETGCSIKRVDGTGQKNRRPRGDRGGRGGRAPRGGEPAGGPGGGAGGTGGEARRGEGGGGGGGE
jgi:peroxiredoxin